MKNVSRFACLFVTVFILLLSESVWAQKKFSLTVHIDSSLLGKKLRFQYDNGKKAILLHDSVIKSPLLKFSGSYYSTFATMDVSLLNENGELYFSKYLVGNKASTIDLSYKSNPDQLITDRNFKHIFPVYDTLLNHFYKGLVSYNRARNLEKYRFLQEHKADLNTNQSVRKRYNSMVNDVKERSLKFIKGNSKDYLAFWYFLNEIAIPRDSAYPDTILVRKQLDFLIKTFPAKFVNSFEGKETIRAYRQMLNPIKNGNRAPDFKIKTIEGKSIQLKDFAGKVLLIDFWATWCGPCMREIPFLKALRGKFDEQQFVILGINRDRKVELMKEAISREGMNWIHYFDDNNDLSKLFGVNSFPTYFLIDQQGTITFTSLNIDNDDKKLEDLINQLISKS